MTLRHLLNLFIGMLFFSSLSFAVCSGISHQTELAGYALSPDSSRIAAIARDGALFWWGVDSGKRTQLADCVLPEAFDQPILFSPDSTRVAVLVYGAVHVFDIASGQIVARLTSLKLKQIYAIAFSGDGRRPSSFSGNTLNPM